MRIFSSVAITAAIVGGFGISFAGSEPPPAIETKDLVKMSTHVLIGTVAGFQLVESSTGRPVLNPKAALRPGEAFEIEVVAKEILQQPDDSLSPDQRLKVRFTVPNASVKLYRDQLLPKGKAVFLLCKNRTDDQNLGAFFPFYGANEMWLSLGRLSEVRSWVEKVKNLK